MARHVKLIAILMFVQAGLETIMAVFYMAMGPFMRVYMEWVQEMSPNTTPPPQEFDTLMGALTWIYVAMGIFFLIPAGLRIFAGVRILKFKGRVLAIVSLAVGIITSITCYCAPTGIGLLVFGLIVLLNAETIEAFRIGEEPNLRMTARTFE